MATFEALVYSIEHETEEEFEKACEAHRSALQNIYAATDTE